MEAIAPQHPNTTIVATPNGLVLSSPKGQFLIKSTVGESRHEVDPLKMLSLHDSDPQLLALQTMDFAS